MNKATRTARDLSHRLRTLDDNQLAVVGGAGQFASTSTSGSPEAGDDTVSDQSISTPMLFLACASGQH